MANDEHVVMLARGAEVWNGWRADHNETPDLSRAGLRGLELSGFDLSREAFPPDFQIIAGGPSDVAARARQARCESGLARRPWVSDRHPPLRQACARL
jgi:hypothetical protein